MKNVLLTTAALNAIVREASASWTMIKGADKCTIVGNCVYDSGGATGNYGNNEILIARSFGLRCIVYSPCIESLSTH
jgi:hypothetical protein